MIKSQYLSKKLKGLLSGADDFLSKPVEDLPLMARVRSLSRLKMMTDELRMRQNTQTRFGMIAPPEPDEITGNILIIESNEIIAQNMIDKLPKSYLLSQNCRDIARVRHD